MKSRWLILLGVLACLLLSGCAMKTVDEMYCLPRRSEAYQELQRVLDAELQNMEYCAPLSGMNQQPVQAADVDGDGVSEFLVFAKASGERPLRILVIERQDQTFTLTDTLQFSGTAFDQVEYMAMDDRSGVELVVGIQLSNQLLRSVSAYTFTDGKGEKLLDVNYTNFLAVDLDRDNRGELFVLYPGQTEESPGFVALYEVEKGVVERSLEVKLSAPVSRLQRVITGELASGETAVFVASALEDTVLVTDVYAMRGGVLTNISLSNESGTSVSTIRNHFVYAQDIDEDGQLELPALIPMKTMSERNTQSEDLIRWYSLTITGEEVDKLYTYHNFVNGWYLVLDSTWAQQVTVTQDSTSYSFYLWDLAKENAIRVLEVEMLYTQDEISDAMENGSILLYQGESSAYVGTLTSDAAQFGLTQEWLRGSFHLIYDVRFLPET
ncbi:MAG TPA: hypothetical protein IAB74_01475 [Candidatus Faecousia excrementigallinarum]|uniref:VCBS repeat-containing protein n=1 Tax=Candidatus Faecousia excrementigallinarum TaxID=2840806 RepID=A0A9D0Z1C5_9FIRM|nr:hypothetical protein [Candidatus Faecousia excrementigallinarum]